MLIIRLQRRGAKNAPNFRLVLAEKHRAAGKKAVAIFGQYDPRSKELKLSQEDQLKMWLARQVELSPTVRNLLISKSLLAGTKVKAWRPKPKTAEQKAEIAKKAAEAKPAAETATAEPAPAVESTAPEATPKEETKA